MTEKSVIFSVESISIVVIIKKVENNSQKMYVSINISELLEAKAWSLTYLSEKTGISYQQLWNIKMGRTSKVAFETIARLLVAFNCTPNELFTLRTNHVR